MIMLKPMHRFGHLAAFEERYMTARAFVTEQELSVG
jgi:hypothetical protein